MVISFTLKKRDQIIKYVRHKPVNQNIKFGIQVPNSVEDAYKLGKRTQQ